MPEIKSVVDLLKLWPEDTDIKRSAKEYHLPCPFCDPEGERDVTQHNGVVFVGDDRFVLFNDHAFCRRCHSAGRGHRGVFFVNEIAARLNATISVTYDATPKFQQRDTPLTLLSETQVVLAHGLVDREFWHEIGWTDETINRFRLGKWELYFEDGPVNIIPMEVRTVEPGSERKWFAEGRPDKSNKDRISTKRLMGSSSSYFWYIHDDPESKTIVLTEGAKDAITAYTLGFKNVICTFGTSVWTLRKTRFLHDSGYQVLYLFGDNDEAGQRDLANKGFVWATKVGLDSYALRWNEDKKEGYDISDLLLEMGVDQAREYIRYNLYKPDLSQQTESLRPIFIRDYREIDPYYEPEKPALVSLEEIRGDGSHSMRHAVDDFLKEYPNRKKRGKGLMLLLNAPPGSGKTHQMVQTAEQVAQDVQRRKAGEWVQLNNDLQEVLQLIEETNDPEEKLIHDRLAKSIKDRIDNFSHASVLWSTQYKTGFEQSVDSELDPSLWFEFKARSFDNCENYNVATTLGEFNHDVGAYCAVACPFRDKCKKDGYLGQEQTRRLKPITVIRHQHLKNQSMLAEYLDLVLIDESPLTLIDTPMVFTAVDFRSHVPGWEIEVADGEMVHCIVTLEQALRTAVKTNADEPQQFEDGTFNKLYMLSGTDFLKILDLHIKESTGGTYNLVRVIRKIDPKLLSDVYQPTFINGNVQSILKRSMPFVFNAILNEIDDYDSDNNNQIPSSLHLVAGKLEVYKTDLLKVGSSTPLIVADATATLPELYQAAFARQMDIYSPQIRNPNARIIVAAGSDWTRGELEHKLGRQLRDRHNRKTEFVEDIVGTKFYLHDIPTNPNLYADNKLLKDYEDAIYSIVEQHASVLVVVHKKVREVLEDVFKFKYPNAGAKIRWGHYGALRGTNQFKDCEAAILLGVSRIPYDVIWRKVQAWGSLLKNKEPIKYQFIYKPKPYHGHYLGHTYRTFDHPFAQRYVDMVEEGEMIQSMERIRPHSTDDNKFVYVFASRPVGKYISQITTKGQVLNIFRNDSTLNRAKTFITKQYKDTGKIPTKREVMTALKCGYETYKEAIDLTEKELGVKLTRSKKGENYSGQPVQI